MKITITKKIEGNGLILNWETDAERAQLKELYGVLMEHGIPVTDHVVYGGYGKSGLDISVSKINPTAVKNGLACLIIKAKHLMEEIKDLQDRIRD